MGDIGPLSNEFSRSYLVIDVAALTRVQVCPEGGDEVIWFKGIWDSVWFVAGVVGIIKKGKISVAAQEDEVILYREGVESKDFSKINFRKVVIAQGNLFSASSSRNIIKRRAFPGRRKLIWKLRTWQRTVRSQEKGRNKVG